MGGGDKKPGKEGSRLPGQFGLHKQKSKIWLSKEGKALQPLKNCPEIGLPHLRADSLGTHEAERKKLGRGV